jgi:Ca2+-binding RTX toxin-like protein
MDDDMGTITTATVAWIAGIRLTSDGELQIIGSSDDDQVTINRQGNGDLKVHADFLDNENFQSFPIADVKRIISYLCQGDDHLTISGNVTIPAVIHGDSGNDHLNGGGGPAVLLGGAGDDMLVGGSGSGLLIGGFGLDKLVGGNSTDVLIGGEIEESADDELLLAALAAWDAEEYYPDRVATVDALLSVIDDLDKDKLKGGADLDLYFAGFDDDFISLGQEEEVL